MKKTCLFLSFLFLAVQSFAQDAVVPEYYELEEKEDYAPYEDAVVNGVNWMLKTPLGADPNQRSKVNKFVLLWIMGSPDVHVEINPNIVNFMETSPDLLVVFLGGWTKYVLETEDEDKVAGNKAGLEAILDFYTKNKTELKKDKAIQKYLKMQSKGTLDAFIKENMQQP